MFDIYRQQLLGSHILENTQSFKFFNTFLLVHCLSPKEMLVVVYLFIYFLLFSLKKVLTPHVKGKHTTYVHVALSAIFGSFICWQAHSILCTQIAWVSNADLAHRKNLQSLS